MTKKARKTEPVAETGVRQAIRLAGGVTHFAAWLGVSYQRVQHWEKQGYIPRRFVVEAEAQTGIPRRLLIDPRLRELTDTGMGDA